MPKGRFSLYLKARKIVSKRCLNYLARVSDSSDKVAPIHSVPILKKFIDVFPNDPPKLSLEREIDFDINIIPDTQPIFILQ